MRPLRLLVLLLCPLSCLLPASGGANAQATSGWQKKEAPLMTRWSAEVSPENALPEYPRPQMARAEWLNLNGLWEFAHAAEDEAVPAGQTLARQILVPFPIESALSGVMERAERAWYRRTFTVPRAWQGRRVLLHFGAVDWEATVYVNGREVGTHRGGYDGFSFDITEALLDDGPQELIVGVYDPTDEGVYPRGKQVDDPSGIFYTPVTGIWQTVWLEPIAPAHIAGLRLVPDIGRRVLTVTVEGAGTTDAHTVRLRAADGDQTLGTAEGRPDRPIQVAVPDARLWSPDDPVLYDLHVELIDGGRAVDSVTSYFGMREIRVGQDENEVTRILLNGEFVFQLGPLDQGYWPDGLYTAPTDAALRFDIEAAKEMGFNMIRKHAKVEPQRWYYWADRLGMLVWQDMPSVNPAGFEERQTEEHRTQFETELQEMITEFFNHPSIVLWVVFNEGWGQYDTERLTRWAKELDPTRLVTNASGWVDFPVGDVIDMHRYPGPGAFPPEPTRASVLGEFGGLGLPVAGHTWQSEDNWGYQAFTTPEELRHRYERLFDDLWALREDPGLSAAVYTQITDVETETNGLLTYDRAVWKIPADVLRALHRDDMVSFPAITPGGTLFMDSVRISITNRRGEPIHYTLDGTAPGPDAPRYTGPITLTDSAVLTARSFAADGRTSGPTTATFTRVRETRAPERNTEGLAPGLAFAYYEGDWNRVPDFAAETPVKTGTTPQFGLDERNREDLIGFRFTGYVEVPREGVYTFYTESDDGSLLYIGDTLVVDNDGLHGMAEQSGQIALQAGRHPIRVDFFEGLNDHGLVVRYDGPGIEKQEIPARALSHRPR